MYDRFCLLKRGQIAENRPTPGILFMMTGCMGKLVEDMFYCTVNE